MRASGVASSPFTMCPKKDGSPFSVGDERGFANCPAILPTFTTGSVEP